MMLEMASAFVKSCRNFMLCSLFLFHCSSVNYVNAKHEEEIPRVGIIGGGLGGASAAYFLRQLFGPRLQIDIFEGENVGGRLALVNIGGQNYEAGGTIIHNRNAYMVNFCQLFGLERQEVELGTLGLFNNSDGLFFKTSRWTPVTLAKLLWRYGWDLKRIGDWVSEMMGSFERIYDFQDHRMAFTTVEDLLRAMNEQFVNYSRISGWTLLRTAGFSDLFINELAMGGLRDNYGQTPDVHGFVTAVSMAGVEKGLWKVKEGNRKVVESLIKKSGANLVKGIVTELDHLKSEAGTVSYEVQYDKAAGGDDYGSRGYDIVIMATPIQSGSKLKIRFELFPERFKVPDIPFHTVEAVFVLGTPNISYFGIEKLEDFPDNIMTTDPGVFFNKMSKQEPVMMKAKKTKQLEKGDSVWKVFLNRVPAEQEVKFLFDDRKDLRIINWLAYPKYRPKMAMPSFVLHDRLYFVNAIEAAASAMEMSVIGARNVALLAYNQWFGHFERIDELEFATEDTVDRDPSVVSDGKDKKVEL